MPKKPTEPFGHIAFGKDGSIRKHVDVLPDQKSEQELEVGRRFASGLTKVSGEEYEVLPCEENYHDFWLKTDSIETLVQMTEIVSRDYLRPLSAEDYRNGNHTYTDFVVGENGAIFGVDQEAKANVLLERIKNKLSKNYGRPSKPLWLLVWTVRADFSAFYKMGGMPSISPSVVKARKYLANNDPGPFDAIWFSQLGISPARVWPL